jgi:YD repeat-containing protein
MEFLADVHGHLIAQYQEDARGNGIVRDALGQVHAHMQQMPDGSSHVYNAMGQLVEQVRPMPGNTWGHYDALGQLKMTRSNAGGREQWRDHLGQLVMQHDPGSGNFTNALGQLAFRKFST